MAKIAWGTVGFLGAVLMLYATRTHIGLTADSLVYISAARQWIAGHGLMNIPVNGVTVPLTHFPPLYPLLLGVIGFLAQRDPWEVARWLNGLLFGTNALLAAALVYRNCGRSSVMAWVTALLMISAVPMIQINAETWSEPLYLFWMLLGLLALMEYLRTPRLPALAGVAIMIALAVLTRFAGAALILSTMVILVCMVKASRLAKLIASGLFLAISAAPIGLWSAGNLLLNGQAVDRQIVFHPLTPFLLQSGFTTITSWMLANNPMSIAFIPSLVGLGAGLCLLWLIRREHVASDPALNRALLGVLLILSLTYLAFLVLTITFVDAQTPLDQRILAPQFVVTLLIALCLAAPLLQRGGRVAGIVILLIGVVGANYLMNGVQAIAFIGQEQPNLGSPAWQETSILERVRALPADAVIVSSDPRIIYFYTGRAAYWEPIKFAATTLIPNSHYAADFESIRHLLEPPGSLLIHFNEGRAYLPNKEELLERLPLQLVEDDALGSLYQLQVSP